MPQNQQLKPKPWQQPPGPRALKQPTASSPALPSKPLKFHRQTPAIDEEIVASYDPEINWHEDPQGYFLIRTDALNKMIEVAWVTPEHLIRKVVRGRFATEIYHTIIQRGLLSRFEHAAYLGKELYKAELALKYGKRYRQSFPLHFQELKVAVELEKES